MWQCAKQRGKDHVTEGVADDITGGAWEWKAPTAGGEGVRDVHVMS